MKHTGVRHSLILILLLYFFGQAVAGIRPLSLTYDEPIYTSVGYADLVTSNVDWHEHVGHPPVVNLLTAWPLLLNPERPDPRTFPQWGSSDVLGFARSLLPHLGELESTTFVTRIPVIWIALLLAALVYRWANETWHGSLAGIFALLLFVLDPTIRAHGRLNSTDMGLAAFGFLSAYLLTCYLKQPNFKSALFVGLSVGLSLSSKASGPYYVGIAGLLLIVWTICAWRNKKRWLLRLILTGLSWLALALLVLWAAYLFELQPLHPGGIPVPAASHWKGLNYINAYMQSGQTTYFQGKLYTEEHPWQYFPVGFLVKTPIPTLIFFLAAIGILFWRKTQRDKKSLSPDLIVLVSVPTGYFLVAILSALQIGQRHLLPIYPFMFVLCGGLAKPEIRRYLSSYPIVQKSLKVMASLLTGWLIFDILKIYPYELSYFNILAGGSSKGAQILADSSTDWGQAIRATKVYMQEHKISSSNFAAFSSLDPALYGLTFRALPPTLNAPITMTSPFNPVPGTYLISAVPLHGLWVLDPDTYAWFRYREPDDVIAHAIFVYDVPPITPEPGWVAQCTPPLLNQRQIAEGFGIDSLRVVTFDCAQSWIYPPNRTGWYIIHDDAPVPTWMQQRLLPAELTYAQRDHWSHPALRIYMWDGKTPTDLWKMNAPANTNGPLNFMGYELNDNTAKSGSIIELNTFWKVKALSGRPLSLMAHLIGPEGTGVAVGDGLGVSIEQWQIDDIIVQRHSLSLPPDASPGNYVIRTGAYWLDTMERWTLTTAEGNTQDHVDLLQFSR